MMQLGFQLVNACRSKIENYFLKTLGSAFFDQHIPYLLYKTVKICQ